ncbi:MAG: hypothetical protein ACREX3_20875 [Gammaproteobacteria bacterium]
MVQVETLISCGPFSASKEWEKTRRALHKAIRAVDWPPGSGKFTIFPESGKRRRAGNGVTPIKRDLMEELKRQAWKLEEQLDIAARIRAGSFDAVLYTKQGPFAFEWETGNISSSHRALNKMALGLLRRLIVGGTLVVPSRNLYQYLTDRVGNFAELAPYLDLWKAVPCKNGVLEIAVIEQDAVSRKVPKIPKGTSGRALA